MKITGHVTLAIQNKRTDSLGEIAPVCFRHAIKTENSEPILSIYSWN